MEYLHKVPLHIFLHTVRLNRKGELGEMGELDKFLKFFHWLSILFPKYILHFFAFKMSSIYKSPFPSPTD